MKRNLAHVSSAQQVCWLIYSESGIRPNEWPNNGWLQSNVYALSFGSNHSIFRYQMSVHSIELSIWYFGYAFQGEVTDSKLIFRSFIANENKAVNKIRFISNNRNKNCSDFHFPSDLIDIKMVFWSVFANFFTFALVFIEFSDFVFIQWPRLDAFTSAQNRLI